MTQKKIKASLKTIPTRILVSGSLTFDTVFELNSAIADQVIIEDNKPGKQNLIFTAKEKDIYYGGTAGNIVYGLGLLKQNSFVLSVIGKDFGNYENHLKDNRCLFRGIKDISGYTATFFGLTDTKKEQIGIFQGGVYTKNVEKVSLLSSFKTKELKNIKCAIFAAGTAKSITKEITEFRKLNSSGFTIFDPGQILAISYTKELLDKTLKSADILILNENEFSYFKNNFKLTLVDVFRYGVSYVIETKGEEGSVLYELEESSIKETRIKAVKVKKVIDPTGAGDAYRAALIYGIINGMDIKESLYLASKMGAECVKHRGGQTYNISFK